MDKVRVALIGCGGFQRYRVANLLRIHEAEIVALVDPSHDQLSAMGEKHPVIAHLPSFEDHRSMLEQIDPDAVVIATPHCQHADQILDSFEARCHVLTEKPLVTAVTDAERVIAARDASGKVGLVSYQRHYQPEFRAIRQTISSGRAGPVRYISALLSQEWLRGTSGTWRQQLSLSGGGFLNDSGSHLIDIILWSTGLRPNSVAALCDRRGTEVDINSTVSAVFDGGATATFSFIGDGMSWHEEITIWCEDLAFFIREGKLKTVDRSGVSSSPPLEDGSMTPDQNFIDCILGRAECESPFEGGLEVARFTDAIYRSSDAGGIPVLVASGAALVL